jgi:tetratricopeptide (TPR) repeat protein
MFKGLFGNRSQQHYARGIEQFDDGLLSEAIQSFEEAIAIDPDGPDAALARFYRADAQARIGAECLERGDWRGALDRFDAALADHSQFPDLHLQRAMALMSGDDPLAAERAAMAALALNPEFVDAGAVLVVAVAAQGRRAQADELAEQWARIAAGRGDPLAAEFAEPDLFAAMVSHRSRRQERRRIVEHAESCLRDGFWADAAQSLAPLVEESPEYPDLRLRLAAAQLGLGDLPTARQHLERALQRNPRFADARVLAGIVGLREGAVQSARTHFEAAEESGRVVLVSVYGRALCDLRTGRFAAALGRLNQLAGEGLLQEEARVLHGILESRAGRNANALERLEAAVVETYRTDLLLDVLSWSVETAQFELGEVALERVEEAARTSPDVVRGHARLRLAEGARDRARQLCESALVDHPQDPGLLIDLAGLLARQGDHEAGLRCLESMPPRAAGLVPVLRLRATLLRLGGNAEEARRVLESALAEPDAADALELLYICRAMDDTDRASELWSAWSEIGAADLSWRIQDLSRWLGPLRPWPAAARQAERTA